AAEDAAGLAGGVEGGAGVGELAEADLLRGDVPGVLEAAEMERGELGLGDTDVHPGEFLLGELEGGDGLAELPPGGGVVDGGLQAGSGGADGPPHDAVPRLG